MEHPFFDPDNPISYSYSKLASYATCPAKLLFRKLDLPTEPAIPAEYGSAAHAHFEARLKEKDNAYDAAQEYLKENVFDKYDGKTLDKYRFRIQDAEADMKRSIDSWEKDCYPKIVGKLDNPEEQVERKIEMPFRLGKMVGKIDLLFKKKVWDWKGLALDTALPTPHGWTTMGEIQEGDELFDANGNVCKVIGKSSVHHKPCYRLTFGDGTEVICDEDHRWVTITGQYFKESVLETREIAKTLLMNNGQINHRVKVALALDLPSVALPIDPYVLGCWIGDGKSQDGSVCGADEEIFANIQRTGMEVGPPQSIQQDKTPIRTVYGLRGKLREAMLLDNKHIPKAYFRASIDQRLALLQGLMDTDGTYNRIRNQAIFTTVDEELADSFCDLVKSLGMKPRKFRLTKNGFGLEIQAFDISFTPVEYNPFRLSRKANLVKLKNHRKSRHRAVTSVTPVASVPTQCIAVDSPDHTYLCTRAMIPTHNTGKTASEDDAQASPQGGIYTKMCRAAGIAADQVIFVYTKGVNIATKIAKTGKNKGSAIPDKENPSYIPTYRYADWPDEKVDAMMAETIEPLAEEYENGIVTKRGKLVYNACGMCEYRAVCDDFTLPTIIED